MTRTGPTTADTAVIAVVWTRHEYRQRLQGPLERSHFVRDDIDRCSAFMVMDLLTFGFAALSLEAKEAFHGLVVPFLLGAHVLFALYFVTLGYRLRRWPKRAKKPTRSFLVGILGNYMLWLWVIYLTEGSATSIFELILGISPALLTGSPRSSHAAAVGATVLLGVVLFVAPPEPGLSERFMNAGLVVVGLGLGFLLAPVLRRAAQSERRA